MFKAIKKSKDSFSIFAINSLKATTPTYSFVNVVSRSKKKVKLNLEDYTEENQKKIDELQSLPYRDLQKIVHQYEKRPTVKTRKAYMEFLIGQLPKISEPDTPAAGIPDSIEE